MRSKQEHQKIVGRISAWLNGMPINPRRMETAGPKWVVAPQEGFQNEGIAPNSWYSSFAARVPKKGLDEGLLRHGICLIGEDDEDDEDDDAEYETDDSQDGDSGGDTNVDSDYMEDGGDCDHDDKFPVPKDVAAFKFLINDVRGCYDQVSLYHETYEKCEDINQVLRWVVLPSVAEIRETKVLAMLGYQDCWDHFAVLPGSVPLEEYCLRRPGYENDNTDHDQPGYAIGFINDNRHAEPRIRMAFDHLANINLAPQARLFHFPFFTVEIKTDRRPLCRVQNLYNAGTMLRNLQHLAATDSESSSQDLFCNRVRAATLSVTAEEVDMCCYWAAPGGADGEIKYYGQVIGCWKLGKEPEEYARMKRVVRNVLQNIANANYLFITICLLRLGKALMRSDNNAQGQGQQP